MQVLATLGREFEDYPGLGYIEATVDRIQVERHGLPLPHMGWSELQVAHPSPLFAGMSERPIFYFVHSYHLIPRARDIVLATCNYGDDLVAVVEKDNVYGVQFHPEKSQHDGLRLLKNFAGLRA
jgi:glutamine amidotransferase